MGVNNVFHGKSSSIPFTEKGGRCRGILELLTGCYPMFLFGGKVGKLLPVFHFHEVTREGLERILVYLAGNGYKTITTDAISRFVNNGTYPGEKAVALCFDDAWASLWTVAAPLLHRYSFSAIAFAIPARIADATNLRPTIEDGLKDPSAVDKSETPFATWPELRKLSDSGIIDVQCHTFSHSKIFTSDRVVGFVTPDYLARTILSRPLLSSNGEYSFIGQENLGAPLYSQRSRMSDGYRFFDDEENRVRCQKVVSENGATDFFFRPDWKRQLHSVLKKSKGRWESSEQRKKAIHDELDRGKSILSERLSKAICHLCFPWGVAGRISIAAMKMFGYETAFSDKFFNKRAVKANDDPYRLMRLKNRYIFYLPGQGRKIFPIIKQ